MKKFLAVSVPLKVALVAVLGLSWKSLSAEVADGGGAGTPVGNGDVNADGTIDVSDTVYLISRLFLGGPAPVPIECPPAGKVLLPATGQTKCYEFVEGRGYVEVPCDQAPARGQDGQYAAGCPSEGRFTDNGDGTVTDMCTGLMWQKDTADLNRDGRFGPPDTLPWCDALAYCEDLDFAGHTDWRLPNVRELGSIIDYGGSDQAIYPVFGFRGGCWSSSSLPGLPSNAWYVDFSNGVERPANNKDLGIFVRAVRSGPLSAQAAGGGGAGTPVGNGDVNADGTIDVSDAVYLISRLFLGGPAPKAIECPATPGKGMLATGQTKCYGIVKNPVEVPCDRAACQGQDGSYQTGCSYGGRFTDNGDGTVTDMCTGLMWQKDTADVDGSGQIDDGDRLLWRDALAYCEDLDFGDHTDWRLPNERELQSIVDYGRHDPAIDPVFGAVSDLYGSSSSFGANPNLAWCVHMLDGALENVATKEINLLFVRAVRSRP